ncbi:MAG: hypothetical protein ABSD63_02705 [Candidatus Korobacteraceae bacterium]|jgi:hypothetical protein
MSGCKVHFRVEVVPSGTIVGSGIKTSQLFETYAEAKRHRDEFGYAKHDAWIVKVDRAGWPVV